MSARLRRKPEKTPTAAITDLESLPLILTIDEMTAVYRVSESTIRRGLQNGTFRPRPWEHYPYRWQKADVAQDLKRRRDEHTMRKHGFASTRRLRTAKAAI